MAEKCKHCGNMIENDVREEHNEFCPMQYPVAACKEMALKDWWAGFLATDLKSMQDCGLITPELLENPIFQLGYKMGHPEPLTWH